jgi:putative hemolysin
MLHLENLTCALIFLLATSSLVGMTTALLRMGRLKAEETFSESRVSFFFQKLLNLFFEGKEWEGTLFALSLTKQITRICYALLAIFYLSLQLPSLHENALQPLWIIAVIAIIIGISLIVDLLFDLLAVINPQLYFRLFSPFVSLILTISFPFSALFFKILQFFIPEFEMGKAFPSTGRLKDKILEILQETELSPYLDMNDKKLILSVISFKDRIAREVMVPRIDVYSLPSETTIQEAAKHFLAEGYSRIPIYKESVDHITGVLLSKDVLKIYTRAFQDRQSSEALQMPIESLTKPVLYSPETKKISHLLQEFRSKQIHLAIVVDEYGGTEGIVTIEDILEELVGEIADEYDIGEEVMYTPLASGGWIVDARMTIVEIEKVLGVKIPLSPEYDTIGGYIYHRAGTIPGKGWKLHHEDFDLEILSSDERSIDKIRIIPNISGE